MLSASSPLRLCDGDRRVQAPIRICSSLSGDIPEHWPTRISPGRKSTAAYDLGVSEIDFLVGKTVEELRYPANGLRIVFEAGDRVEPALYADVEQAFTFTDRAGLVHEVDPNKPATLGPVLTIAGETVVDAVSTEEAALTLRFSDRSALACEPHPSCEAWQVVGGSPQYLVVSIEPGHLAVWDDTTKSIPLG